MGVQRNCSERFQNGRSSTLRTAFKISIMMVMILSRMKELVLVMIVNHTSIKQMNERSNQAIIERKSEELNLQYYIYI